MFLRMVSEWNDGIKRWKGEQRQQPAAKHTTQM